MKGVHKSEDWCLQVPTAPLRLRLVPTYYGRHGTNRSSQVLTSSQLVEACSTGTHRWHVPADLKICNFLFTLPRIFVEFIEYSKYLLFGDRLHFDGIFLIVRAY